MQQVTQPDADALFEMANLFPRTTGLPMQVWVSPRGTARHYVPAVVDVRPTPHVIAGQLDDRQTVFEWASLNTAALVAYWEGRIDAIELGQLLKRIPSRQPGAPSTP